MIEPLLRVLPDPGDVEEKVGVVGHQGLEGIVELEATEDIMEIMGLLAHRVRPDRLALLEQRVRRGRLALLEQLVRQVLLGQRGQLALLGQRGPQERRVLLEQQGQQGCLERLVLQVLLQAMRRLFM